MKRRLLTQMRSEWRSNVWLVIELLLVSMILWYVDCKVYHTVSLYNSEKDFDLTDVYVAEITYLSEGQPGYSPYDDGYSYWNDISLMLNQMRENPYAETVGTGKNSMPYTFSYQGQTLYAMEGSDTLEYYGNSRMMDANTIRIIGLEGANGETSEQIIQELDNFNLLLSNYDDKWKNSEERPDATRFKGKILMNSDPPLGISNIVLNPIRRSDFEPMTAGMILWSEKYFYPDEVIFKVKHGKDLDFSEWVSSHDMKFGNIYISRLQSMESRRESANRSDNVFITRNLINSAFLLALIFLGILGSFWFRVQERVPEIAIRKAMGARRMQVLRRLLSEAFILLGIALVALAGVACWLLNSQHYETVFGNRPEKTVYGSLLITVVAMALIVLAGVCFPARRAMKINPVTALKEQ
ncbi:MAG: FtsX-like permease family protein [Muribaculaceae bacterium]|nr:FtsX-like permease family protein [Muribaculaceae bacterium]